MGIVFFIVMGLIGGFLSGFVYSLIFNMRHKSYGVIDVDHENGTCLVHLTSTELENRRNTKVIFTINHNADLSRDEQSL